MAASVRLEDETFSCMRYERLAELAGLADSDHARGKMARLWRQCTLEQRHALPESDIVRVLGPRGVRALVDAGLGEIVDSGVRIKGTRGRIEWLKKARANGKKGGRPRKPNPKPSGFDPNNLPAPAPAPVATKPRRRDLPPSAATAFDFAEGTSPGVEAPSPPSEHQAFIAEFDALYAEHNAGARPTWGSRQGKVVAELLRAHGLEECRRRAGNMFRAPPQWPPPPHDLATLAKHFDLFAKEHRRTGGHFAVTGTETYAGGEVKL